MSQDILEVYLAEAQALLHQQGVENKAQKLVDIYTQAALACPDQALEPYMALAYFAYSAHHYQDALLFLQEAMKIDPFHQPTQRLYKAIQTKIEV
jgi:hypothetical protein